MDSQEKISLREFFDSKVEFIEKFFDIQLAGIKEATQ